MDWFIYDKNPGHESVNHNLKKKSTESEEKKK